jgi:formylglycine-generating enzyme required for sulfatase activity
VYRARQRSLDRIVALKVLKPSLGLTRDQIERFTREPRAIAQLNHPHIAAIYEVGEEDGSRWFAMEYVEGKNLAEELDSLRRERRTGASFAISLPGTHTPGYFRAVAEVVRQAADALECAHRHGKVHRDVKPGNLLIDATGCVKVVDFGIARDERLGSLTKTSDVLGTPSYMSPEQLRAIQYAVDHRTDVYSLGVVLYELCTLERPFKGDTELEIRDDVKARDATALRKLERRVPRDLETICLKAMAKEPRHRYASAAALRDDLARFLAGESIVAQPPRLAQVLLRRCRRHRRLLLLAGVALVSAVSAIVVSELRVRHTERTNRLELLRTAFAEGPLRELDVEQQQRLLGAVKALEREPLAAEDGALVTRAALAFQELRDTWHAEAQADLAFARDTSQAEGDREFRRLRAIQTFLVGNVVFPEDREFQRLATLETGFPVVSARALDANGAEVAADVHVRPVDPLTSTLGEPEYLGRTPLAPTPLEPGDYRLTLVYPSGRFREFPCRPSPVYDALAFEARLRTDEEALTAGMVEIPRCLFTFPDHGGGDRLHDGKTVELPAFWIDEAEVSNLDYQRYVLATGAPAPLFWKLEPDIPGFLRRHGDLPVVGISWKEASAYARWAGKRLPTTAEWLRACVGLENRAFPYASSPAAPPRGNVAGPRLRFDDDRVQWDQYLAAAAPVRSHPDAATPEGILHLYGNVQEYLESPVVTTEGDEDVFVRRAYDCWSFGAAWDGGHSPRDFRFAGIGPRHSTHFTGFRCARSSAP